MVDLLEYCGKNLFRKYGIPVPESVLVDANGKGRGLFFPAFLKAQVPAGHRKELGGVIIAKSKKELTEGITSMKKISFNGFKPSEFILEKPEKTDKQVYLSLSTDRSTRAPVLIVSEKGGTGIEKVGREYIHTYTLNPFVGVPEYVKREIASVLSIGGKNRGRLDELLESLWRLYTKEDAELVEINPLGVSKKGLIALDSKVTIDDDALFRHADISPAKKSNRLEQKAAGEGISFVRLSGDIGLVANGAGLTMATIDMIAKLGGKAGDFLDLGGTDEPSKVAKAMELVSDSKPKVLLINIFAGVTKADTVSQGIVDAVDRIKPKFEIIVRLSGFNTDKGKKILATRGIEAFDNMSDAIRTAVQASKR